MKWAIRSVLLVLVLFVCGMVVGYFRPESITVERSIEIDADAYDVFPYLNDLTEHMQWASWAQIDPDMEVVFGGPPAGVGQRMVWISENPYVGNGSEIIMESVDGLFVRTQLEHAGEAITGSYALQSEGQGEVVVLIGIDTHLGGFPYIQRLFAGGIDAKTGAAFEQSLENLKALVISDIENGH